MFKTFKSYFENQFQQRTSKRFKRNDFKMRKRKVYKLKPGNIANLRIVEEPLPEPKDNEVTVEVKSIGLNFADLFAIWGLYSATPKGEFVPGLEYSGVIIAIGENVKNLKIGDRVMGITRFGAYMTHLNIDHRYAIPLPDDWNFQEGAGFLVQMLTAYYGLINLGNLQQKPNGFDSFGSRRRWLVCQ